MKKVITIDGPSGAGKSTIARILARKLGFDYLDTGALYRAVALYLREKGYHEDTPDEELAQVLKGLNISFYDGRVFIYKEDVSDQIRTPETGHYASVFSAKRPVREFLLGIQRAFADAHDTVAEGRDMGTVVFPNAWKKIFLTASVDERARRRFNQLMNLGKPITFEEALKDVKDRDERDSKRDIAPLKKPEDAFFIDTSELTIDETIERIMRYL